MLFHDECVLCLVTACYKMLRFPKFKFLSRDVNSLHTASPGSPLHRPPWCLVQRNQVHGFLCLEISALSLTWQCRAFYSFLQDAWQANLLGCEWDDASDSTASGINSSLLMIFITLAIVPAVDIFHLIVPRHALKHLNFEPCIWLPFFLFIMPFSPLRVFCFLAYFHLSLNFNCKNYIHGSHLRVK